MGEIVGSPGLLPPNRAENAEKPHRSTLLAEPFPGTVAQGDGLPKVREMNELSFGQNQLPAQIRVLGARGRGFELSSIFAAIDNAAPG